MKRFWFPVAVLIAAGLVALWVATRPLDPRGVAEEFFAAWRSGDTEAHLAHVSAGSLQLDRQFSLSVVRLPDDLRLAFGKPEVDGARARVPVSVGHEVTTEFGTFPIAATEPVFLVREGRDWKVDLEATIAYQAQKRGVSPERIIEIIESAFGKGQLPLEGM
jgi:hypothetical protein